MAAVFLFPSTFLPARFTTGCINQSSRSIALRPAIIAADLDPAIGPRPWPWAPLAVPARAGGRNVRPTRGVGEGTTGMPVGLHRSRASVEVMTSAFQHQGSFHVYILECVDGSYYTGSTNNLAQRLKRHHAGRGAKYLRGRLPARLVYAKTYRSYAQVVRAECRVKQLTRRQKEALIREEMKAANASAFRHGKSVTGDVDREMTARRLMKPVLRRRG